MQTALITGASSGIGLELAKLLPQDYGRLILVARDLKKLEKLAQSLRKTCLVEVIAADLSKANAAAELFAKVEQKGIIVDLLINNAGSGLTGPFFSHSSQADQTTIDLNIVSLTHLCKMFGQQMLKKGSGIILNVASTGAFQPGSYIGVYYASKSYVYSLSLALADELKNSGLQISVLCPGATATNFSKRSGKADLANAMPAKIVAEKAIKGIKRKKTVIIPGWGNKLAVLFSKIMPDRLMAAIVRKIQKKQFDKFNT